MAFYDITPVTLGQAEITTSYATIYTAPALSRTFIKDIDICNTTSGVLRVFVSFVSDGDAAGAANAIFYNALIPAYTTVQWCGSQLLYAGGTIQVKADNVGLTITASGGEAI